MPLSPGTQVGSYEIVSLLGAGGMGEVYRARDPRLKREVALKVLPDVAAADADRRERFTREALAVAALNHPHIVTIHSVEDAGTAVFLTMELVEGRSLAEALPATGLPIERVLTIGIAVADATSAAHQKGITHRDLKPGNIMLGEGEQAGRIKVLDFGLAKVVDAQRGAAGASMLPTEAPAHTAPITAEGRILGTVAYMSPEQAEGRTIDGRSDLFSLGVVLYEMATGQRPFAGDTQLSILSSILKDTPKSVTDINPAIPPELGRIIRRALAKDPERRYQTAKDLRNDLEDLKASLGSSESPLAPATSKVAASVTSPSEPSASPIPSSDTQVVVGLVKRHSRAFGGRRCRAAPWRGGRSLRAATVRRATGVEPTVVRRSPGDPADNERQCGAAGDLSGREIRRLRAARWRRLQPVDTSDGDHEQRADCPTRARRGALRRHVYA